jgi:hypothetical protein
MAAPLAVTSIRPLSTASPACRRGGPSGGQVRWQLEAYGEPVAVQTDVLATLEV